MQETLEVQGVLFTKVPRQRPDAAPSIEVYKGPDTFLRIGEENVVQHRLSVHSSMANAGFPVASIVKEGNLFDKRYYIEKSLGERSFTDIFYADMQSTGKIADEHFSQFLQLVETFLKAQIRTARSDRDVVSFAKGTHLETLCRELSPYALSIKTRFNDVLLRTKDLPYVTTHGDLNPANMYTEGIIDLEDSFFAPLGFDVVSAVTTTDWFPRERDYESFSRYRFTENQLREYYGRIDAIAEKSDLPRISEHASDFEFARALWLTARMGKWPKLQKWRFDRFIKNFIQ